MCTRCGDGHTGIFEGRGRIHALVLSLQRVEADNTRASRQIVEWRVALAQSNDVLFRNVGKEFAKAPDTALVEFMVRGLARKPDGFKGCWIKVSSGENEFEQVAAGCASELLTGGRGSCAAGDAAELRASFGRLRDGQVLFRGRQRLKALSHLTSYGTQKACLCYEPLSPLIKAQRA